MPTKPTKKTATKPLTSKRTVSKKTVATTKAAPKKTVKTSAAADTMEKVVAPETPTCKCGSNCNCGSDCKCARGGSRFGRFMIKLIMVLIVFALGFGAAKLLECDEFRGPRVDFDNGCLDVSSVKCPQLQMALPVMDINRDGCISHEEYRAVKQEMGRQMRAAHGPNNPAMRD